MATTPLDEAEPASGSTTRRSFIRGVAVSGASTAAAVALDGAGVLDLGTAEARAAGPNPFSAFTALGPSAADAFSVPPGYRADVVIAWGDAFANDDGTTYEYGFNNDFLAYFPIRGSDEGLLFVNHEYPAPYFIHGTTDPLAKTKAQIALEQDSVGNAIVHIRRRAEGGYAVVSPSPYNRRVTGGSTPTAFTGPLAGNPDYPGIGTTAQGSLANCSGGITPWGTALSCEENFQDYAATTGFGYGWTKAQTGTDDYYLGDGTAATATKPGAGNAPASGDPATAAGPAKYGWVVEHDPFDASSTPRKHTALGRFRHENTTFRAEAGKPFVLYMGEDRTGGGVYKFVSDRSYVPGRDENNRRILESGTLYIARWTPQGRRTFATSGDVDPTSATDGAGTWVAIAEEDLVDTYRLLRERYTAAVWDQHFATNRPEDLEVAEDGTVFIALTNNSDVKDAYGSIRRLVESGEAAGSMAFTWEDYAAGGPSGRGPGEEGFASPDNIVFDNAGNMWVVTDISSSSLNKAGPNAFHANNAVFMIPRTGPNAGVAFRFANMPIESEGTGPYFTPDEQTLFVNVQHPGEETKAPAAGGDPVAAYTSYWPAGNKTTGQTPAKPRPATVAITKVAPDAPDPGTPNVPVPPPGRNPDGTPADELGPRLNLLSPRKQKLSALRGGGIRFELRVDEPVTLRVTLYGRLSVIRRRRRRRGPERRLVRRTVELPAGTHRISLRPSRLVRARLRRETAVPAELALSARDAAGNVTTRRKALDFRG